MSDPPASYYESGQSLIQLVPPPSPPKRREPTPPKQRRHDSDQHSSPRSRQQFSGEPRRETAHVTGNNSSSSAGSPKSPKNSKPRSIDKPLKSHQKVDVLQGTSGPTFKQQSSGGSILKVEGITVPPSQDTMKATEEARRQQAADRQNSASLLRQSNDTDPSSPRSSREFSELRSSSATHKQDNRQKPDLDRPKLGGSSTSNRSSGRPLPQHKPVSQNQFKSTSDIWEFDTPNAKSSCCTVM